MFKDNPNYFPTPVPLIHKLLDGLDFKMINNVLEPSAGDGRLVEAIVEKFKYAHSSYYNREAVWDIDCIELEKNLQFVLQGKKLRVIHDDFTTFQSFKSYDAIIANFPFSEGEHHLLKAIEMQSNGGIIHCIINAETLRNPYSNARKELLDKLEQYNANIEYIKDAFLMADRISSVEIALIKIDIPKLEHTSIILDELRQQESHREESQYNNNKTLINADFIKGIIEQYNFEIRAGLKLMAEYDAIKPLILDKFEGTANGKYGSSPILQLVVQDEDKNSSKENAYIKKVRSKYWSALFSSEQFMGLFTSNLRQKYFDKIKELRNYDFSLFNIYTIKIQLNNEMVQGVNDTIIKLFDEFSYQSSYDKEFSRNIHYYSGWCHNSCWKVNKKIIIRLNAYNSYSKNLDIDYQVKNKLSDIEKCLNYLNLGDTPEMDLEEVLKSAQKNGESKKIRTRFLEIDFFKKGTTHMIFLDDDLLLRFNIFGSKSKNWLPPSYGKKSYKDMTPEDKVIINDFQGKESYELVMANKDYYIVETSKLLMLA